MVDPRELDPLIAEKVLGMHVERIKPDWYPLEVMCFYREGSPLIVWSFDAASCNAMMFRNGVDASDGTAEPLPQFSDDIADAWRVVEYMQELGWVMNLDCASLSKQRPFNARFFRDDESGLRAMDYAESAPLAICRAALKACGVDIPPDSGGSQTNP